MASPYLNRQSPDERKALIATLHQAQHCKCFICEQEIDLILHQATLDIDHVVPTAAGGRDDPDNFALTHASCNRVKQASNLEVARILSRFARLKEALVPENRSPNLGDILQQAGGGNLQLSFEIKGAHIRYSFSETGDNQTHQVPLHEDDLSGFRYFFAKLPIQHNNKGQTTVLKEEGQQRLVVENCLSLIYKIVVCPLLNSVRRAQKGQWGWSAIKAMMEKGELPHGSKIERPVLDDTLPGGPKERVRTYVAPFARANREEDYQRAWEWFAGMN